MVIESILVNGFEAVRMTFFWCDINKPQHTLYMSIDSICVYATVSNYKTMVEWCRQLGKI